METRPEPQVTDHTTEPSGSKPRTRVPTSLWLIGGGLVVLFIMNLIFKPKAPVTSTVLAGAAASLPKPSTDAQAEQSRAAIKTLPGASASTPQPLNGQTAMTEQGQGQTSTVDPAAEIRRRRDLAMSLSPGGWVKAPTVNTDSSSIVPGSGSPAWTEGQAAPVYPPHSVNQGTVMPWEKVSAEVPGKVQGMGAEKDSPYRFAESDPDTVKMPDGSQGYVLRRGMIIDAVLENELQGEFSGPVRCHTTNDVRTQDRQHLLVPSGSILLGEAAQVGNNYQRRLAVLFTDLQVPGYSIDLGKATGLDQQGATALRDKVNRHLLSTVASVVAIGALSGIAEANGGATLTASGTGRMESGIGEEGSMEGEQILQQSMNRHPEITIRPGNRVRVFLNHSLVVPAQEEK
jgi:type IV secretory pathway VirB10-like protein